MVSGSSRAALKVLPNAPKTLQDSPKRRQDGSKGPQDGLKMDQRDLKMAQRWPQERSYGTKWVPKWTGKGEFAISKKHCFSKCFSIKMTSCGVKMVPFGALKSIMLDHFGFKALYGEICWLKLSHVDSC